MKFLQTKPHVMSLKNNYCDLYYTVTKNKNDKEIVNDKNDKDECEYNTYDNFNIPPNHSVGVKTMM